MGSLADRIGTSETRKNHAVKVKLIGRGRFEFLTPDGGTTNLRVHAGIWNELGATEVAAHIVKDNPGMVESVKVVELFGQ